MGHEKDEDFVNPFENLESKPNQINKEDELYEKLSPAEKRFREELDAHDWLWQFSDDHSVFEKGRANENRLWILAQQNSLFTQIFKEIQADRQQI